jgi:hypothetical protein
VSLSSEESLPSLERAGFGVFLIIAILGALISTGELLSSEESLPSLEEANLDVYLIIALLGILEAVVVFGLFNT